ncbi:low affinity immunoglobulin gamma Fc region receptor II-like isoform X2 [Silurus meridionalis]|uniref:low affinity immunoglobulin gamma Fc region receptor II-like isoform X2 n=1 Tax=Silurus meridionalis TaxID=175797 RepID=UPI001EEBE785|nr:low affinity immunoglobulin gamma Fc region receptor II-like isoform X2 [Silurus meridionalis]
MSDVVTLTVSAKPKPTVRVNPQSSIYIGDTITLNCDLQSTGWEFQWYKNYDYLDNQNIKQTNKLMVKVDNAGETVYQCKACRENSDYYNSDNHHCSYYHHIAYRRSIDYDFVEDVVCYETELSDPVKITVRGESPPVSLIISPSRTQHFAHESLSLSCEDQSNSTGWTVRRYTDSEEMLDCSQWGSVTGSTCYISFLSISSTGVYWCKAESGVISDFVNITVHYSDVILESPVHPVSEGDPLTLRCLYDNANSTDIQVYFYKDGSVVQNQTTGEMIIYKVSKSDEGFYHCKHPERGESPRSWISVRGPSFDEAPLSVLMLISSVVTASPYLLVTIILLVKCYRARAHTDEDRIENAVIEEKWYGFNTHLCSVTQSVIRGTGWSSVHSL